MSDVSKKETNIAVIKVAIEALSYVDDGPYDFDLSDTIDSAKSNLHHALSIVEMEAE